MDKTASDFSNDEEKANLSVPSHNPFILNLFISFNLFFLNSIHLISLLQIWNLNELFYRRWQQRVQQLPIRKKLSYYWKRASVLWTDVHRNQKGDYFLWCEVRNRGFCLRKRRRGILYLYFLTWSLKWRVLLETQLFTRKTKRNTSWIWPRLLRRDLTRDSPEHGMWLLV